MLRRNAWVETEDCLLLQKIAIESLKDYILMFAAICACFLDAQPIKSAKILQEINIYSFNREFLLFQKNLD